jgi:hypothetical protein
MEVYTDGAYPHEQPIVLGGSNISVLLLNKNISKKAVKFLFTTYPLQINLFEATSLLRRLPAAYWFIGLALTTD